jgi:hypothetical protein
VFVVTHLFFNFQVNLILNRRPRLMSKVFISYMHDNQKEVNLIAAELRREGLHVWLDRDDINPGEFWEKNLQNAIRDGAYFLACFSKTFQSRQCTYMNDELRIACELSCGGVRDVGWLIPILLSPCEIPAIPVSDESTLRDIQWIDLSNDWNTGIWKLIQVVRPTSSYAKGIDTWFRQLCALHIKSNIDRAWTMGAFRVRDIEDGWRNLLLPSRWNPTLDIIVRLFEKVKERQVPLTERWIEPTNTGIIILITVSPSASINKIFKSLSPVQSDNANPYKSFIKQERKILHNLVNWQDRDMAHWIFAIDGEDHTMDLLYLPNLRLTLTVIGLSIERKNEGNPLGPIEYAYPGSLLSVTEYENMFMEILSEEVELL